MNERYQEQAVLLGKAKSLVGIVTRPSPDVRQGLPGVVILNTGIVHRVGHHRMYVTMARELAAAGHIVLRFDFSGIGDSKGRTDALTPLFACFADIEDALDRLTASYELNEVVLVGLCSGADVALRYGFRDERVVGLALLDPTIPPTARFYRDYVIRRMMRLRSWLTFARGRGRLWGDFARWLGAVIGMRSATEQGALVDPRTREELKRVYCDTLSRNVQLFVALTGDRLAGRQTYRDQLLDAFPDVPFEANLRLEYFPQSDHTFAAVEDRKFLNSAVLDWLRRSSFRRGSREPARSVELRSEREPLPVSR